MYSYSVHCTYTAIIGCGHLIKVKVVAVMGSKVRVTRQPSDDVPSAKVQVILRVSFPYCSTTTDWTPDVTVWRNSGES